MAINQIHREIFFLKGLTILRNQIKAYTNLIHNHSETISNTKYDKKNNETDFLCLTHLNFSMLPDNNKKKG